MTAEKQRVPRYFKFCYDPVFILQHTPLAFKGIS